MESVSTEGVTIKVEPKETISVTTKLFVSEEGVLCGNEKLEPQEHPFITADTKNEEDSDNVDVKFEHKFLHGENEGEDTIFVSEGSALYTGSEPIKEDRESAPESSDTKCFVDVKFEEEFLHDENVSVGTNLFSKDSALYTGSKPIKEENKSAPKSSDTKRRQEGRDDDNCKRRKLESDPEPASLTKEEVQTTDDEDDEHEQSGQALTPSPGHPRAPSPSPRLARHEVVDTQAHGEGSDESDGGTPPSAPSAKPLSSKAPASKKKRTYSILPEEKEMAVAEWYREHELLYNKKLWAYRDRERKDIAYRQMATEINVTVEALNKWMEGMRTRYGKLDKLPVSGSGAVQLTERDAWIKTHFAFLKPHLVKLPTRKSKLYKTTIVEEEMADDVEPLQEGEDGPESTPTPTQTTATQETATGSSAVVPTPGSSGSGATTSQAPAAPPDLYDKLREGEKELDNLYRVWQRSHQVDTPAESTLKPYFKTLLANMRDLPLPLIQAFQLDVLRFSNAMISHNQGLGPVPHFGPLSHPQSLNPPQHHPQRQQYYETLNVPSTSTSYHHIGKNMQHSPIQQPDTPTQWKAYGPSRPGATPVQASPLDPAFLETMLDLPH